MGASDLPVEVRRLLAECLTSASQLEILLLLHRSLDRSWTAAEVDSELRVGEESAAHGLRDLRGSNLVTVDSQQRYRFDPRDESRRRAVSQLAEAYRRRRVSVVEFLYKKPSDRTDRISLFSDAFRFRRGED